MLLVSKEIETSKSRQSMSILVQSSHGQLKQNKTKQRQIKQNNDFQREKKRRERERERERERKEIPHIKTKTKYTKTIPPLCRKPIHLRTNLNDKSVTWLYFLISLFEPFLGMYVLKTKPASRWQIGVYVLKHLADVNDKISAKTKGIICLVRINFGAKSMPRCLE